MPIDRRTIRNLHWQPRVSRAGADTLGEIVTDIADVEQAINTIVLTEKGSVPTEPEKCTRLLPYIDRRPDFAIPNITREIFDAITAWEPRVVVERVAISAVDFAHWRFPVFWRLRSDVMRTIYQTTIILPEDRRPAGAAYAA